MTTEIAKPDPGFFFPVWRAGVATLDRRQAVEILAKATSPPASRTKKSNSAHGSSPTWMNCWSAGSAGSDNKPTDQVMGRIAAGYQPPRRNELGDIDPDDWDVDDDGKPRDPWQFYKLSADESRGLGSDGMGCW